MTRNIRLRMRPPGTTSIAGITIVIIPFATRSHGAARTVITSDRKIWIPTGVGESFPTTGRCGCRRQEVTGLLIEMVGGFGNLIGDGPGFPMNLGDGHRITTDAGSCMTIRGFGGPGTPMATSTIARSGLRRMFRSSGSAVALGLDSVAALDRWAGFRSGPVTASIRGGVDTGRASTPSTSTTIITAMVGFRRYAGERCIPTYGWHRSTTECGVVFPRSEPMSSVEVDSGRSQYRAKCFAMEDW